MECLQAQSLVSDAMDKQPVDATLLAQAKEHCRDCPACSAFVKAQLVAKRAPLPQPPADLADRVMIAVRIEAEQAGSAASVPGAVSASQEDAAGTRDAVAPPSAQPDRASATLAPPKPRRRSRLPRSVALGGMAAAAVLALLGTSALVVYGVRQMTAAPRSQSSSSGVVTPARSKGEAAIQDYQPPPAADAAGGARKLAAGETSGTSASSAKSAAPKVAGTQLISVNGVAYLYSGPVNTSLSSMSQLGTTVSALGSTNPPAQRSVYQGLSADAVYLTDDSGHTLSFQRLTRTYLGLTYQLASGDIIDFGQFPSLPSQISTPTAADGSPTFTYDGTDSSSVKIYRLTSSRATEGIAIGPGTYTTGALAGDPYWTWWSVIH